MSTRDHEPEREETEETPPLELHVELKAEALLRCPYCHGDLAAEAEDWVSCRKCLARHHTGCWRECGRCATCSHGHALTVAGGRLLPLRHRLWSPRLDRRFVRHDGSEATQLIAILVMLGATALLSAAFRSTAGVVVFAVLCFVFALFWLRTFARDRALLRQVVNEVKLHKVQRERREARERADG